MSTNPWVCPNSADHFVNTTMYGWPKCSACKQAPPYHERFAHLSDEFVLGIYVPTGRALTMIRPNSAVVGLPNGGDDLDDWTQVYYEGWVNGPMQYADRDARGLWEAGVFHAAGRMVTDYPTIAQANLPSSTLVYVGLYTVKPGLIAVDNEDVLAGWLA